MNFLLKIVAGFTQLMTLLGHILVESFTSLKGLNNYVKNNKAASFVIFLVLVTLISKEIIIFDEEVLVVISFLGFVYFLYTKISDMVYLELVSRNEKLYREADLNLFYHQKVISEILDMYKTASYVQNKLRNEYTFFRHVFLANLWPCKAVNYVNNNINTIEKNLDVLVEEQKNISQDIQFEQNTYNYELLKVMSKLYLA